jgi:hypothetical protein
MTQPKKESAPAKANKSTAELHITNVVKANDRVEVTVGENRVFSLRDFSNINAKAKLG